MRTAKRLPQRNHILEITIAGLGKMSSWVSNGNQTTSVTNMKSSRVLEYSRQKPEARVFGITVTVPLCRIVLRELRGSMDRLFVLSLSHDTDVPTVTFSSICCSTKLNSYY